MEKVYTTSTWINSRDNYKVSVWLATGIISRHGRLWKFERVRYSRLIVSVEHVRELCNYILRVIGEYGVIASGFKFSKQSALIYVGVDVRYTRCGGGGRGGNKIL